MTPARARRTTRQEVIGREGYADASVDRIAEAAGVARSTVYVYFDGKEALLDGCLRMGREELGQRVAAALEKGEGAEGRLAAFLEATLGYIGENRAFFRAVMAVQGLDAFFGDGGASAELATLREESRIMLDGILREGVESGELPALDLDVAGELLGTLLYGALMRRSHAPLSAPAGQEARRLAHLFLYGASGSTGSR